MSQNIKGVAELELKTDRFNNAAKKSTQELKALGTKGTASMKSMNQPITALYNKLSSLGSQGKNASDKIRQGASQAKQAMTGLGTSGKMASDQITQSANTAKQSLSTLGAQGRTSMGHLGNAGTKAGTQVSASMSQASTSVRNLGAATQQTSANMGVMVLGVAALGTSMGTTYTGMTALDKAQLKTVKSAQKLEKAHIGVARANDLLSATQLAVERFTLSIAAMERNGKTDTDAYAIAVKNLALQNQKLTTAYDDLAVKMTDIKVIKESVRIANVDLEDTYTNMTISIFNTVLMSAFLAKTLLPGLSVPTKLVTGLTATMSGVYKLLGPNIARARMHLNWMRADLHLAKVAFTGASLTAGGFTAALTGVSIGVKIVSTSLKAMWAALGPIGWAVLGIVAAYEIWENNLFGIQEAAAGFMDFLHDMWNLLKQISPVVAGLAHLYEKVFPPALEDSKKATENLTKAQKEESKTLQTLEESLKKYDRIIANSTSSDTDKKIALNAVIEAQEKQDEANAKTLESAMALNDVEEKHNRRLKETIPLLQEIRKREAQAVTQKQKLHDLQLVGNGETIEAIKLQEELEINIQSLISLNELYETSHIGVVNAQESGNEAMAQASDDIAAYSEVIYDAAGNIVTLDNGLVSVEDTMAGLATTTGTVTGAFGGLNGELGRTETALHTFDELLAGSGVEDLENRVTAVKDALMAAKLEGIDPLSPAFKQAKDSILPEIESISGALFDTFGEERMDAFGKSMVGFGVLTVGEMDKIRKAVGVVAAEIEETKKNYDSLGIVSNLIVSKNGQTVARKGLVTQKFFDSLPAGAAKGQYRPQSGSVGLPTSLRDSIARRKTKSLTPAGLLARVFSGGFLRRDEAFFWKKFKLVGSIGILRDYKKFGLDTKPIFQLLKESTGSPHKAITFAKDRIYEYKMMLEDKRLEAQADRQESLTLLGSRLGITDQEFFKYTEFRGAERQFEDITREKTGASFTQFHNFIKTNSGRQDLANLIAYQQREDFLAALV